MLPGDPGAQTEENASDSGSEGQESPSGEAPDSLGESADPANEEQADSTDGEASEGTPVCALPESVGSLCDAVTDSTQVDALAGETVSAALALGLADGTVNLWLERTDRYAAAASQQIYPNASGGTVIIATDTNFPDSLSAAGPAAKRSAPLLLTVPDRIPDSALVDIYRLKPRSILGIGSAAAVNNAAEQRLRALDG